jgi:hypothetical protein
MPERNLRDRWNANRKGMGDGVWADQRPAPASLGPDGERPGGEHRGRGVRAGGSRRSTACVLERNRAKRSGRGDDGYATGVLSVSWLTPAWWLAWSPRETAAGPPVVDIDFA